MDTKHPDYQKRDSAQRAKDRAAREARRVRPVIKGAIAKAVDAVKQAVPSEWQVPVSMPSKDKK